MRVFRCDDCGHRMRFLGRSCGKCGLDKRPLQRGEAWIALGTGGALLILLIALALLARG